MTDKTEADEARSDKIKQMQKVVCICKGIKLGKVLPALPGSETVADVNQKAGTGSGGCKGERCGPRIKILLKQYEAQISRKKKSKSPSE